MKYFTCQVLIFLRLVNSFNEEDLLKNCSLSYTVYARIPANVLWAAVIADSAVREESCVLVQILYRQM